MSSINTRLSSGCWLWCWFRGEKRDIRALPTVRPPSGQPLYIRLSVEKLRQRSQRLGFIAEDLLLRSVQASHNTAIMTEDHFSFCFSERVLEWHCSHQAFRLLMLGLGASLIRSLKSWNAMNQSLTMNEQREKRWTAIFGWQRQRSKFGCVANHA